MVDVISEITGKNIVMEDTNYVFLDTKENVEVELLNEAIVLKKEKEDALNFAKSKEIGENYTLDGVDYKVSFMKDDADGMMQVSMAFSLGLTNTIISFENGTKMPIKNTEFETFAIWFVGKRNSYFVK
jgi:hypothetical protein